MVDRFTGVEKRRGIDRLEDEHPLPKLEIDGVYWFQMENGKMVANEKIDKNLEEYALQVSRRQSEIGRAHV